MVETSGLLEGNNHICKGNVRSILSRVESRRHVVLFHPGILFLAIIRDQSVKNDLRIERSPGIEWLIARQEAEQEQTSSDDDRFASQCICQSLPYVQQYFNLIIQYSLLITYLEDISKEPLTAILSFPLASGGNPVGARSGLPIEAFGSDNRF